MIERYLEENCNLVKRGTHEPLVEGDSVFVVDKELVFPFEEGGMQISNAQEAAKDAFNAPVGCLSCPIYKKCLPTPVAKTNKSEYPDALIPALRTSFEANE